MISYPDDMGSKFKFIVVTSQRCRQLQKGAKPRVPSRSKKFTTIAQEEVLANKVEHFDEAPEETAKQLLQDTEPEQTAETH